jgi:hypothetical protein
MFICGLSNLVSRRLQQALLQSGTSECCVVDIAAPSCLLLKVLQSSIKVYEFPDDKKQKLWS